MKKIFQVIILAGFAGVMAIGNTVFADTVVDKQAASLFNIFKLKCKADMNSIYELQKYINDDNADVKVREFALRSLVYIIENTDSKQFVPVLWDIYINSKIEKLKNSTRAFFIKLKVPEVFMEDINSADINKQMAAARNLIEMGTEESRQIVLKFMNNEKINEKVKEDLAVDLCKLEPVPELLPVLLNALKNNPGRQDILLGIASIANAGNIEASEALKELYEKGNFELKANILASALNSHKVKPGFKFEGTIPWKWLPSAIVEDISSALNENPLKIEKIRKYFVTLSFTEDENAFLHAYNMAKSHPEIIKDISHPTLITGVSPQYALSEMKQNNKIQVKLALERLIDCDLSRPAFEIMDNYRIVFDKKNISIMLADKDLRKQAEDIASKLLNQAWIYKQISISFGSESSSSGPLNSEINEFLIASGNEKIVRDLFENAGSNVIANREKAYSSLLSIKDESKRKQAIKILINALNKEQGKALIVVLQQLYEGALSQQFYGNDNDLIESMKLKINYLIDLMINSSDLEVRLFLINMLVTCFPDNDNVLSAYSKLLSSDDVRIVKAAVFRLTFNCANNNKWLKPLSQMFLKVDNPKKNTILEIIRERLKGAMFSSSSISLNDYYDEMLNSRDEYKTSLALAIGVDASVKPLYWHKALGRAIELLEDVNAGPAAIDTSAVVISNLCMKIRSQGIQDDEPIVDYLAVFLAEKYNRLTSSITKKCVFSALDWSKHAMKNETMKSVWEKASKDKDEEIRKIANDYLKK